MTDIVQRLRSSTWLSMTYTTGTDGTRWEQIDPHSNVPSEAADESERLRARSAPAAPAGVEGTGLTPAEWVQYLAQRRNFDATPAAPSVPEGWRLVPVEPTEAMRKAYHYTDEAQREMIGASRATWAAMLAAAPQPG